jgi:hypothetical protein
VHLGWCRRGHCEVTHRHILVARLGLYL